MCAPAWAQTDRQPIAGEQTIVVTGTRQAYRCDFKALETPQAESRIDAETLRNAGAVNLDQALDLSAAVARQNNFGGLWNAFALRGFVGDVNLPSNFLVNGFNAGRGFGGPRDLSGIESVEVLRGPRAPLFGRGEPGDGPLRADALGHQIEFQHDFSRDWSALLGVNRRKTSLEGFSTEAELDRESLDAAAGGRRLRDHSKGMRQKVAIALAMLRETEILLLDEPACGLDPIAIDELHTLVRALADGGKRVLMVAHDVYGACQGADRIGLLRDGRLVGEFAAPAGGRIETERVHRAFADKVPQ